MTDHKLPVIAIVGRPNVGKSALFNAILRKRVSIVHEQSGVTRDPVAAPGTFAGRHFLLVDTGGLGIGVKEKAVDLFDGMIRDQVAEVIAEADVLIWVVDCLDGITPQDREVAEFLRQSGKPLFVAANKADNENLADGAAGEFAPLGVQAIFPTSCTHNRGIPEILGAATRELPVGNVPFSGDNGIRIAVVGRPNVGKSSVVNRLLGTDRVMVSDIAGTTRDAIDIPFAIRAGDEEVPAVLIDTAGLRRRARVDTVVEFFSVNRSEKAIRRADIVLFVIDSMECDTTQDRKIARMINEAGKPCILLANKWDLASAETKQKELVAKIRSSIAFMGHAPLHVICATSGYNFKGIVDHILVLREQMQIVIPTAVVNRFLRDIIARTPPPAGAGNRRFKIMYATMTGNPPPSFVLFANSRDACPPHYRQFLENSIREAFFPEAGLPIRLDIRERAETASADDGTRRAVAGVVRDKNRAREAADRHRQRRKGWRKR